MVAVHIGGMNDMRTPKLALIAPNPEFALFATELFKEWGEPVHVAMALRSEVLNIVQQMTDNGVEAIICPKAMAPALRAIVNVPVVALAPGFTDIAKVIIAAKDWIHDPKNVQNFPDRGAPTIGVSQWLEFRESEWFGALLGISISIAGVDQSDSEISFQAMVREISDPTSFAECEHEHTKPNSRIFPVAPGWEVLLTAIRQAKELVFERWRGLADGEQLKAMMQFSHEGIVVVDNQSKILYINATARAMLKTTLNDAAFENSVEKIIVGLQFEDVLQYGQTRIGHFNQASYSHLVYRIVPMTVANETIGAMLTIFDSRRLPLLPGKTNRSQIDSGHRARFHFVDFITANKDMKATLEAAKKYAAVDSALLITGETGTGKEIIAQSVHNLSGRCRGPFVAVNFAALPESLLESELFGYESGSFTGARKEGKIGLFEQANGGTIFLDEIGEATLAMQARLLRVVQEKAVMRVGATKVLPVDVRILAATHRNLLELIDKGLFRRDLYHRLNVLQVRLLSLAERTEDVPVLIDHLNVKLAERLNKPALCFSAAARKVLLNFTWPGNVREVENTVERLLILNNGAPLAIDDVMQVLDVRSAPVVDRWHIPKGTMQEIERAVILEVLRSCESKDEAARFLGISTTTIWRKLKRMQKEKEYCNMQ